MSNQLMAGGKAVEEPLLTQGHLRESLGTKIVELRHELERVNQQRGQLVESNGNLQDQLAR